MRDLKYFFSILNKSEMHVYSKAVSREETRRRISGRMFTMLRVLQGEMLKEILSEALQYCSIYLSFGKEPYAFLIEENKMVFFKKKTFSTTTLKWIKKVKKNQANPKNIRKNIFLKNAGYDEEKKDFVAMLILWITTLKKEG